MRFLNEINTHVNDITYLYNLKHEIASHINDLPVLEYSFVMGYIEGILSSKAYV